jgi:hypothetical protein
MVQHLHDGRLVPNGFVDGRQVRDVREPDLLDGHDGVLVHVVGGVDLSVRSRSDETTLLPVDGNVGRRGSKGDERAVFRSVRVDDPTNDVHVPVEIGSTLLELLDELRPSLVRDPDGLVGDALPVPFSSEAAEGGRSHRIGRRRAARKEAVVVVSGLEADSGLSELGESILLSLGLVRGSRSEDVEVRDEEGHARGDLFLEQGKLCSLEMEDIVASSHDHGELERVDGPSERLVIRRIAVLGDEGDPIDGEEHEQPTETAPGGVVHVDADSLTMVRREGKPLPITKTKGEEVST